MTTRESTFRSVNGKTDIHVIEWLPEGPVRACVQLCHGVAEYVARYDEFAVFLADHGIAVAGNDHLGHGKSVTDESERGWFGPHSGWNLVVEDMKKLHTRQKELFPDVPFFLLGHSMGSFLSRTYMIRYPNDFEGVILSGTGWQPGFMCKSGLAVADLVIALHGDKRKSGLLQSVAFGSYLNHIESPKSANDWLNRDEAAVRKYDDDPLCGFVCSAGLMRDMMRGLDLIRRPELLDRMNKTVPVLFIAGSEDPVGGWSKGFSRAVSAFKKAGMLDVTARLYDGARHEVLNELNRREVFTDVLCWLESKL